MARVSPSRYSSAMQENRMRMQRIRGKRKAEFPTWSRRPVIQDTLLPPKETREAGQDEKEEQKEEPNT